MLLDFLKTKSKKKDLEIALKILKEFKENESSEEWMLTPFSTWVKLEQFEDHLKLLTGVETESVNDKRTIDYYKRVQAKKSK